MNIGEELDRLVAEGRVTSFVMGCTDKMAQVYVKLGRVDSYAHHRAATASEALAGAIEKVASMEAYDLKFGPGAVSERAVQQPAAAPTEPAGIFD